jgi:hypothetical protein
MMRQLRFKFYNTIEDNKYTVVKGKVFIADISKSGRVSYNTTYRKENVFTAKGKAGKFALDTTAQQFYMVNPLKEDGLVHKKQFNSINDTGSGIKSYDGYLNGNWILFYDTKTRKLPIILRWYSGRRG